MFGAGALLTIFLLAVLLGDYLVWLGRGRQFGVGSPSSALVDWPLVNVIVAVHDEVGWIEEKLRNLSELRYPAARLKIWIVDGASSDGMAEAVAAWIRSDARFGLLRLPVANKTAQLNAALARSRGEWIMVTDGDAQLGPDTLAALVAAKLRGSAVPFHVTLYVNTRCNLRCAYCSSPDQSVILGRPKHATVSGEARC